MRLFFAVNFSDDEKNILLKNIDELKKICSRGNFTHRENLHITLAFLGEVERARLGAVCAAASQLSAAPFDITVEGAGNFGKLVWLGVERGGANELRRLASALRAECRARKINFDDKPFSPHLTICRQPEFSVGNSIETFKPNVMPVTAKINSFELMESMRVDGKLIYRKIYSKQLNGKD